MKEKFKNYKKNSIIIRAFTAFIDVEGPELINWLRCRGRMSNHFSTTLALTKSTSAVNQSAASTIWTQRHHFEFFMPNCGKTEHSCKLLTQTTTWNVNICKIDLVWKRLYVHFCLNQNPDDVVVADTFLLPCLIWRYAQTSSSVFTH